MPRTIKIAVIQMDANPAPTPERLTRADCLVNEAARRGAQLVVLPELFNTGYEYSDENHRRAETIDGPTASWMKGNSARLNIHLAGSLLLLDQDEVFNAMLLYAPDGRTWRYDKNYPWGWERGYFRDSHRITVAHTDLGDLGMLICWDVAHAELWKRYAGQVDLMLICSCPPEVTNPIYHFPNGAQITFNDLGPAVAPLKGTGKKVFGDTINQQTAWLGVPAVNAAGCGHIRTAIPNERALLLGYLPIAPWLIKYLPQAKGLKMSCELIQSSKVIDAQGQVLSELTQEQGETFTLAEVSMAEERPSPTKPQPIPPLPWGSYLLSDMILPWLSLPIYRQGLRRTWGERMAPVQTSTRQWAILLGIGMTAGFLVGRLTHRRR